MKFTKLLRVVSVGAILAVSSGAAYAESLGTSPKPSLQAATQLHGHDKEQEAASGGHQYVGEGRPSADGNSGSDHARTIRVGALEVKVGEITLCLLCITIG